MDHKILMGLFVLITISGLLLSGCAVSDYLKGEAEEEDFSLLTEKEEGGIFEELGEVEEEQNEIDEEVEETEEGLEEITGEVTEEEEEEKDYSLLEEEKEIEEEEEEIEEEEEEIEEEDGMFKIIVKEDQDVRLKPEAVDEDEDELTYSFTEPLDENGEWHPTYGDAGEYVITVIASDGITTTSQQVLLVVERVNVPPYIEPIGDIEIDEGETLLLEPEVSDVNNDVFTVTISDPVGDNGVWETDYHSAGEYDVTITAEDAESKSVEKVKIIVNKKNVPPTISNLEDITIEEGETVLIEPEIEDLNGDDVEVTISEPVGDDGVWETGYTDHGEYEITVTADDGKASATKIIIVTVVDVNMPPKIIDIINSGGEGEEEEE